MAKIEDPDAEMVRLAQGGDHAAYDYLVLRYQGRVQSILRRYLRSDDDAIADTAQEVFISAWKALPRFQGKSRFYTWLFSITVNMAKDALSARKRQHSVEVEEPEDGLESLAVADEETPSAEELQIIQDNRQAVERALGQMSGTLREALCLREYEDLSYDDIAQVLDCPINTVRTRIFRARAALAELLDEDEYQPAAAQSRKSARKSGRQLGRQLGEERKRSGTKSGSGETKYCDESPAEISDEASRPKAEISDEASPDEARRPDDDKPKG